MRGQAVERRVRVVEVCASASANGIAEVARR
jgi:hypothetical protein